MASCGSERKLHYPSAKQITQPPGMLQGPTFPGMEAAEKVHHENDDGE